MILFVSDMHFGRGDVATEKKHEAALINCLRHFEDQIEHLFLIGDVYDQYIEYPNLVPKGIARFQGLIAAWTDSGRPVTYLTGNHDPWHMDYYKEELGVNLVFDSFIEPLQGKHVYLNHGDIIASRFPLNTLIKQTLQHPLPVFLYRTLLPSDFGYRLARWVNQRIHSDVIDTEVVAQLRTHAATLLAQKHDLVVMGHSHHAELTRLGDGLYLNTGCWRLHRTFGCMANGTVSLFNWNDETKKPELRETASFMQQTETST
ncbi:MAG: UDP-2,3-diacylglucosamine diphosphatase [Bacteroidota bacterium]